MTKKSKIFVAAAVLGAAVVTAGIPLIGWGISTGVHNKEVRRSVLNIKSVENQIKAYQKDLNDLNAKKTAKENELTSAAEDKKEAISKEIKVLERKILETKAFINDKVTEKFELSKVVVSSLSAKKDQKIYDVVADYIVEVRNQLDSALNNPADVEELKDVDFEKPTREQVEAIANFYEKYINLLELIKEENLNAITTAWKDATIYSWQMVQKNYLAGGRNVLSKYGWGAGNVYAANSFYGTILDQEDWAKAEARLQEAVKKDIVLSKVVIKNNVKEALREFFANELNRFLDDDTLAEISVSDLIDLNTDTDKKDLREFWKYYATEYYNASKHGLGQNLKELKLYKENVYNETENTISVSKEADGKLVERPVYGLGFTKFDLEAKGVGFSQVGGDETESGKTIYDQITKMASTSEDTPNDVYQSGYKTSKGVSKNMTAIASEVAKLIVGENGAWETTIKYDADGIGPEPVKDLKLTIRDAEGNIDLQAFAKWLNQEQFFFGREDKTFYTDTYKKSLSEDPTLKEYKTNLSAYGYDILTRDENKAKEYGSITNEQFYYGALEAFKAYDQFMKSTIKNGKSFFGKTVPDYKAVTYLYERRDQEGVGAYNSDTRILDANGNVTSVQGAFNFNCDPYYSLPKWSVTSFANHEGIMGHHNQIYYARQHLASQNGENLGANAFDFTSYVEGWALFMEWFGIEAGYYGTPDYDNKDNDYYAKPTDFSHAKGITSFFTAKTKADITDDMIKQIKELHGGVYWTLTTKDGETDEKEHAQRAVKLTNMLQYFGALNEAQLRNMRRAVDPAYHGQGIEAKSDLPANASINDVRRFMSANSALGVGDIMSESKRYLNLAGQAISYNAGKEKMLSLYDQVRKHLGLSRRDFVEKENHKYIKEFFDVLLKNSALPLDTLEKVTKIHYGIK